MIKVTNILICLAAAVYMFMELTYGAANIGAEIPVGCVRKTLSINYGRMKDAYCFVLCLFTFECLVLVSSVVYNRILRTRLSFGKTLCDIVAGVRLVVDVCGIILVVVSLVASAVLTSGAKSFRFIDENGKSMLLVRDFESEQE